MGRKEKYELDRVCAYCERATVLAGGDHVLCDKRGVVTGTHHCRKFVYDPLKRKPARTKPLPQVELGALDDATPAEETVEKEDNKEGENEESEAQGETLTEVLPQLELPTLDEIP